MHPLAHCSGHSLNFAILVSPIHIDCRKPKTNRSDQCKWSHNNSFFKAIKEKIMRVFADKYAAKKESNDSY